jgi:hypothetical protein
VVVEPALIPIVLFISMAATAIGVPFARAYAKRVENETKARTLSPDVVARLERMEHAIDSIAIEVERISEGQRFTTKLLSDRATGSPPPSVQPPTSSRERSP